MAPVPTITLGQNADFRTAAQTPNVAEVSQSPNPTASGSATPKPTIPGVFNVQPLAGGSINSVTDTTFAILNPETDGEVLSTLRPEFRGTAPASATLSIVLSGVSAISDTVTVDTDGTWTWSPAIDLKKGKETVTVSYVATGGTKQKLSRPFVLSTTITTGDPAFVSSPSASTKSIVSSSNSSGSATSRTGIPATGSGVPVTGVIAPTLLTGIAGIVIMVIGATLFAL